jgi:glutathione peroxidase-family protein
MMDKIDVNGAKTSPVWAFLKEKFPGDVSWNFAAKFIIDKVGLYKLNSVDP